MIRIASMLFMFALTGTHQTSASSYNNLTMDLRNEKNYNLPVLVHPQITSLGSIESSNKIGT